MKTCIAVVGCHRSGTSVVAGALHHLGISMGHDLMPASPSNPKGYYESMPIVAMHETLLRRVGVGWDAEALPVLPEKSFAVSRARAILRAYMRAQRDDVFGVKDPRMCLFPALWLTAASLEGVDLRALIVHRHQHAIVQSLCKRDGFTPEHASNVVTAYATGMSQWRGALRYHSAEVALSEVLEQGPAAVIEALNRTGYEHTFTGAQFDAAADHITPELCHHGA